MRRSSRNNIYIQENNIFYGISLGFDYCAEHEWGIAEMRNNFKISDKGLGIETRKINIAPVLFKEDKDYALLMSNRHLKQNDLETRNIKDLLAYECNLNSVSEQKTMTAWDKSDFQICVKGRENINKLKELYDAFLNLNVIIAVLKGGIFENSSLSLLILDRTPSEYIEQLYQIDKKSIDLVEYESKIGMTKLKDSTRGMYCQEKYYSACSPSWINYEDSVKKNIRKSELKTEYDIQYWINYSDSDDNYGWYTVEEIKKWLSTKNLKLVDIRKNN